MDTFLEIWMFNLAINAWNLYAIGNSWIEAQDSGGWRSIFLWLGAVITALSLSWNILAIEAAAANTYSYLDLATKLTIFHLGTYFLFCGLTFGIMVFQYRSWLNRNRSEIVENVVYTSYHPHLFTGSAVEANFTPAAEIKPHLGANRASTSSEKGKGWSFGDDDSAKILILIILVSVAVFGGVLVTYFGIKFFSERSEAYKALQTPIELRSLR